jgi:hypothetical protein
LVQQIEKEEEEEKEKKKKEKENCTAYAILLSFTSADQAKQKLPS